MTRTYVRPHYRKVASTACTREVIAHDLRKYKKGTLQTRGRKVTKRKQAVAIALSQARKKCPRKRRVAKYSTIPGEPLYEWK